MSYWQYIWQAHQAVPLGAFRGRAAVELLCNLVSFSHSPTILRVGCRSHITMYVHIYTYVCTQVCIYIYISMYTWVHIWVYTYNTM